MLVVLGAIVVVGVIIGGAAIFASMGDDDDSGSTGNGGSSGDGSGLTAEVGDTCEADLPPELQLVECGYSVFTGIDDFDNTEVSVGFVIENVGTETISLPAFDIEGIESSAIETHRIGLVSVGLVKPGEQTGIGRSTTIVPPGTVDSVRITYSGPPPSPPFGDTVPLGVLAVSNVNIEPGVEIGLGGDGSEGTRIRYAITSEMDRRVNMDVNAIFRNEQGAIIGHGAGPPEGVQPGQAIEGEIETRVPNIADAQIYATTQTALS